MKKVAELLETQAKRLVDRARAGDQNARAMLVQVGRASRAGNPKAKRAATLIASYIRSNPGDKFGNEKPMIPVALIHALHTERGKRLVNAVKRANLYTNGPETAAVILANRVPLVDGRIRALAFGAFGSEDEASIFFYGVQNPSARASQEIRPRLAKFGALTLDCGRCFGNARAIQMVRQPQGRLSRFNSMAAWELGE